MNKLRTDGFTFKRFFIAHDRCPMKVTTDSALLGVWAPINPIPNKVLDIGTGCGIIALMLAQRLELFNSQIMAIDIDEVAINQCQENIDNSPFQNLVAKCTDFNEFLAVEKHSYDLIVSNPPYFESALACRNEQRQKGRYTENLTHQQLLNGVTKLLSPKGRFCLVLPFDLSDNFCQLAKQNGLFLQKQMHINYNPTKFYSLSLLCFGSQEEHTINQSLCMRDLDNRYTTEFRELLKDFYLFRKY